MRKRKPKKLTKNPIKSSEVTEQAPPVSSEKSAPLTVDKLDAKNKAIATKIFKGGMKYAISQMLNNNVLLYDNNKGFGQLQKIGVEPEDWKAIFAALASEPKA